MLDCRLLTILPDIIHEDQTGFMKGRSITMNIQKTIDTIEYAKNKKLQAVIMSTDFEKCFDRIEHCAVQGALQYFNFGPKFTSMMMTVFKKFSLCTQNNGYLSDWFPSERSCHQG